MTNIEGEPLESRAVVPGQRFRLLDVLNADPRIRQSSITLRTTFLPDLAFVIGLGKPFSLPTEHSRNDQLYIVADLLPFSSSGLIKKHRINTLTYGGPYSRYEFNPELLERLKKIKLGVHDGSESYQASPDKNQFSSGKLQFSNGFYNLDQEGKASGDPLILVYDINNREELERVDAEFLISGEMLGS